ncbi:MAG TPA: dTDP-4-dehydrorhamnose 3,5-epimerase [Pricia sp.]|nr:dTDP-4-dehydrorhamnose 3,5-epimerase [Pricia sp.]
MKITETQFKDCYVLEPRIFEDERGLFFESFKKSEFERITGQHIDFVQHNMSISKRGVLRGLHFQTGEHAQSKLVNVVKGEVLDVVVDVRKESKTFGQHIKLKLSEKNKKLIFIPKGMAHGFLALSQEAVLTYQCDAYYHPLSECGILYSDETLNIDWGYPMESVILSEKDKKLATLKELYP